MAAENAETRNKMHRELEYCRYKIQNSKFELNDEVIRGRGASYSAFFRVLRGHPVPDA